jgi:hypothetical protein
LLLSEGIPETEPNLAQQGVAAFSHATPAASHVLDLEAAAGSRVATNTLADHSGGADNPAVAELRSVEGSVATEEGISVPLSSGADETAVVELPSVEGSIATEEEVGVPPAGGADGSAVAEFPSVEGSIATEERAGVPPVGVTSPTAGAEVSTQEGVVNAIGFESATPFSEPGIGMPEAGIGDATEPGVGGLAEDGGQTPDGGFAGVVEEAGSALAAGVTNAAEADPGILPSFIDIPKMGLESILGEEVGISADDTPEAPNTDVPAAGEQGGTSAVEGGSAEAAAGDPEEVSAVEGVVAREAMGNRGGNFAEEGVEAGGAGGDPGGAVAMEEVDVGVPGADEEGVAATEMGIAAGPSVTPSEISALRSSRLVTHAKPKSRLPSILAHYIISRVDKKDPSI